MKLKSIILFCLLPAVTACQLVSPIFVDYNGVRMDVAKWINNQSLLSMQQKRSMVQLSRAQQKLYHSDQMKEDQKLELAKTNSIALHCARQSLSERKIEQLQQQIFGEDKDRVLSNFRQNFPAVKLDAASIQCE